MRARTPGRVLRGTAQNISRNRADGAVDRLDQEKDMKIRIHNLFTINFETHLIFDPFLHIILVTGLPAPLNDVPQGRLFLEKTQMRELKKHRTYDEQIEKLKEKGCRITDEQKCREILENITYYRLSAYFVPFQNKDGSYRTDFSFEKVFRLYEFDRKLRNVLFSAIEIIEVSLRARLSYYHAQKYGPSGYLDPECFNSKHNATKFKETIDREIDNNKNAPLVKHHIDNYGGQFPLWVVSELFTFGTLSFFYNDFKTADKKVIAGVHYNEYVSWLRCCTDLRNICAHYGRLFNRIFSAIPSGFHLTKQEERKLWGAILAVKELFPIPEQWNKEVIPALSSLLEEYEDDVSLSYMSFPENWAEALKK